MDNPTKSQWEVLIQQNQVLLEYLNGQRDLLNDQKTITRIILERLQNPLTVTRTQTASSSVASFTLPVTALSLPAFNFASTFLSLEFTTFLLDERTEEIMVNWALGGKAFTNIGTQTWPYACVLLAFHESIGEPITKTMILSPDSCLCVDYLNQAVISGIIDPVTGETNLVITDVETLRSTVNNFNRRIPCTAKYVSVVGLIREDPSDDNTKVFDRYAKPNQESGNNFGDGNVLGPFSLVELGR